MTEEQATKKKGLSPLAWVGIGCGVLILIAFVVMSAGLWFGGKMVKNVVEDLEDNPAKTIAKGIVMANPELELVETDDDAGTITIRVKETGEVATFDYSQIQEGKLSFESSEGKMTFDTSGDEEGAIFTVESDEGTATWGAGQKPEWIPDYPGAEEVQVAYIQEMGETSGGAFSFSTADSAADVLAFYSQELEAAGFAVQENTSTSGGEIQSAILIAKDEAGNRYAQITVTPTAEATQVAVTFGTEG